MIQPEKKNKAILAYTTRTKRAWFHTQSKKFGFGSTSKMILQALEFLIKTLDNGISMPKLQNIVINQKKDPVWNNWEQKSDIAKVTEKLKGTPRGKVMLELKEKLKEGFEFKKWTDKEIGINEDLPHALVLPDRIDKA